MAQAKALDASLADRAHQGSIWQVGVGLGVTIAAIAGLWMFSSTLVRPIRKAAGFAEESGPGRFLPNARHQSSAMRSASWP